MWNKVVSFGSHERWAAQHRNMALSGASDPCSPFDEGAFEHPAIVSYVDFTPKCLKEGGIFSQPAFEPFQVLVDTANNWLRSNPAYGVQTCETVLSHTSSLKGREPVPCIESTFQEEPSNNLYIVSLRMWIRWRGGDRHMESPQKIAYRTFVPEVLDDGGHWTETKFMPLDATLDKMNQQLQQQPLPGRVINLETQDTMFEKWSAELYDADTTCWYQSGAKGVPLKHLSVIRVYYDVGIPAYEELGWMDFPPEGVIKAVDHFGAHVRCETCAQQVKNLRDWLEQQDELRVTNIQTIEHRAPASWDGRRASLNTTRSFDRDRGNVDIAFVRCLRVYFARCPDYTDPTQVPPKPTVTYRTFEPAMIQMTGCLGCGATVYEDQLRNLARVRAWLGNTQARVISAETVQLRVRRGGRWRHETSGEESVLWDKSRPGHCYIFLLRLYLDGTYTEPPDELMPTRPSIKTAKPCTLL